MAIKSEELQHGCIAKAADDEPVFVLRATDKLAPNIIRLWARRAAYQGCPKEKVDEANALAAKMEEWPHRKYPD